MKTEYAPSATIPAPEVRPRGVEPDQAVARPAGVAASVPGGRPERRTHAHHADLWSQLDGVLCRLDSRTEAGIYLVNQLRAWLDVQVVALVRVPPGGHTARLLAVSDLDAVDRRSEPTRIIERVAAGVCSLNETLAWPPALGRSWMDGQPAVCSENDPTSAVGVYSATAGQMGMTAHPTHGEMAQLCEMFGARGGIAVPLDVASSASSRLRPQPEPGATIAVPQASTSEPHGAAAKQFSVTARADEASYVLVVLGSTARLCNRAVFEFLDESRGWLASRLHWIERATATLWSTAGRQIRRRLGPRTTVAGAGLLAAFACAMLLPVPYRIGCDCEIQPAVRRFVVAPHQGILERALVTRGDLVQRGQVLARFDSRQLELEREALRAELAAERKRFDAALASGDVAGAQIARQQRHRLEAEIEWAESRLDNLEVRSPCDGMVISGDLDKVQGASLQMGRTLFEIAPLDRMLAELAIPQQAVRHVQPGMTVTIRLDSAPHQTYRGQLQHIHPKAETVNQKSVFVGELQLDNPAGTLRPGMQGRARITTGNQPWGWILFHRAWERWRLWL